MGCGTSIARDTVYLRAGRKAITGEKHQLLEYEGRAGPDAAVGSAAASSDVERIDPRTRPQELPQLAPVPYASAEEVVFPGVGMLVQFWREGGKVMCRADGIVRSRELTTIYYDSYFSFLRFPDTGRGGKVMRTEHLPHLLAKLKGVCAHTNCRLFIPSLISLDLDLPGGFQRQHVVRAITDIHVGQGTLAVLKGGTGVVVGGVGGTSAAGVHERVNVRWASRVDGKKKKISVLPEEIRHVSDLPMQMLRGMKVRRAACPGEADSEDGIVVGPPLDHTDEFDVCVRVAWVNRTRLTKHTYPENDVPVDLLECTV
ncbi:hypothetical protein DIPPA_21425 [Diplonema papillatum]|nr:hypothetical protein DIPPA_21425 [Diplonema papillatum]